MTWEEIIIEIRKDTNYKDLVNYAYFDEDLVLNVERFIKREEWFETKKLLVAKNALHKGMMVLDIGAGNGISTIAFALEGLNVTAIEPDNSITIGANAIRDLAKKYKLENNINVIESFGEKMPLSSESFDIVYIRQTMHHAENLGLFLKEVSRVLKPGGILLTVRDHVVNDEKQKNEFLNQHPLHKYYGGENAFSLKEYIDSIELAGLNVIKILGPLDSPINYYPLESKLPKLLFSLKLAFLKVVKNNFKHRAGRLYSFLAIKQK